MEMHTRKEPIVYVGSFDNNVYALNANTGDLKWKYNTNGIVGSSPIIWNGIVYVGSFDFRVYALNANTGKTKWEYVTT
ncbi:MAG: PQQ-binding-like beta-propeller repeat protein, partial [Methanosarcinales archaeon]